MKVIVAGSTSGMGEEIAKQLVYDGHAVTTIGINDMEDYHADFNDAKFSLDDALLKSNYDAVINCVGVNFIEPHDRITYSEFNMLMKINAWGMFRLYKEVVHLQALKDGGQFVSIVSDAAWTPMTHSLAYNASKAAQYAMLKQMAHEDKSNIIWGVAPGKISNTGMSQYIDNTFPALRGWTYEQGRDYQLKGLKTGEINKIDLARFIINNVDLNCKSLHGHILTFGG